MKRRGCRSVVCRRREGGGTAFRVGSRSAKTANIACAMVALIGARDKPEQGLRKRHYQAHSMVQLAAECAHWA